MQFSENSMEKFDSISHFLESGEFEYRVYDMGRKVWEIPAVVFTQIENQEEQYPYPFQQKAWLALLFWPKDREQEAVIWFLQFPVDEMGFLKQASRDAFLIDLLEQTGKNIQAKQSGKKIEDGLGESPFAFKPREDRLAMFHAIATKTLGQEPSQHYQYAHDYLRAKEAGLAVSIAKMPEIPLNSYAQFLENVDLDKSLFNAIAARIKTEIEIAEGEINNTILSSLVRAISSYQTNNDKLELLNQVLVSAGASIEVIAAISGRSWNDLKDDKLREIFIEKLTQHEQMAFSAIIADLMMIPGMRELILGEMRREDRSPELTKKFGVFMQSMAR